MNWYKKIIRWKNGIIIQAIKLRKVLGKSIKNIWSDQQSTVNIQFT
jgi:hypothetical protein